MTSSLCWREVETRSKGRCLVAKAAIKAGAEILACPPDAYAINPALRDAHCHRCLQAPASSSPDGAAAPLQRCSRCGWQRYCGRRCQQADWGEHKHECRALKRLKDKRPGPTLLMAARLLRRVATEGAGGPLAAALGRLMHHENRLPEQRRKLMGEMAALVRELCLTRATEKEDPGAHAFDKCVGEALARLGGVEYVARLLMRVSCNGFTVTDAENQDVGIGLFLGAVAANHSCRPNAHAAFQGATLHLRALSPIAPGEEICIGYIDIARPRRARQHDLLAGYGFLCACARCASPLEAAREWARGTLVEEEGLACQTEGCGGVLVDDGYEAALYRAWRASDAGGAEVLEKLRHQPRARVCRTCGVRVGVKGVTELLADLSIAEGLYERAKGKLVKDGDPEGVRPLFEAADTQYRRVLSPVSAQVLEVGGCLLQQHVGAMDWAGACACLLATAVEAVKAGLHPEGSPAPAFDLVLLGKLEMQLEDGKGELMEAAAARFAEALQLLVAAQGERSPLVEEVRALRAQAEVMARGMRMRR